MKTPIMTATDTTFAWGQVGIGSFDDTGMWDDVKISGGVGQANVELPQDVGIWAEAHGGIGSINISGLNKHGDLWENDLYDKAKVNVRLEVQGGIGEIRITQ